VKVSANQLRHGHVVELNGKLYAVLKAQNIQPGKGTPVTQLEMRGIADGVKIQERYRTNDTVERVFIDEREFQFLFAEGDQYTFMDIENFEQISVPGEVIGEPVQFLQESMNVHMSLYEGKAVAVELPASVVLTVKETEPTVKGQTAASSYKPAIVDTGLRVMVPSHIGPGSRIVVNTEDGSYIERAKD
jgi:elongation factor P